MGSRGFTLLELLIGLFAGIMVLGGISSLFVYAQRVGYASESQMFLQRQGALVMDQMTQRILSASVLTRGQCNADPNSIRVINANFTPNDVCFYLSPTGGGQLLMESAGPIQWNLLSRTAANLKAASFTTVGDPTGSPPTSNCTTSCTRVTISFRISDNRSNSMTFTTDLTRRN
jgi:hypothetical protein